LKLSRRALIEVYSVLRLIGNKRTRPISSVERVFWCISQSHKRNTIKGLGWQVRATPQTDSTGCCPTLREEFDGQDECGYVLLVGEALAGASLSFVSAR